MGPVSRGSRDSREQLTGQLNCEKREEGRRSPGDDEDDEDEEVTRAQRAAVVKPASSRRATPHAHCKLRPSYVALPLCSLCGIA